MGRRRSAVQNPRMITRALASLFVTSLLVAGCGSDDSDATGTGGAAGAGGVAGSGGAAGGGGSAGVSGGGGSAGSGGTTASGYAVKVVANPAGLRVGKSQFQLEVTTKADGKPATGLAPTLGLNPVMQMGQMAHSAPVPIDAVKESATPGTYDATLFFSMASGTMGGWSLKVSAGKDAIDTLPITVDEASDTDTTHTSLKNAADTIKTPMGSDKPRNWFLFRDTLTAVSGGHDLELFLATVQDGNMVWPPVTVGLKLVDGAGKEQLTVTSLGVQVSTDGATWAPMACGATARCKAKVSGLTQGAKSDLFVKLAVNGTDYTTDGAAVDSTKKNGFATFSVTAP